MAKMGEKVDGTRDRELQKKAERDYIQECIEKDAAAHAQDQHKKIERKKQIKELHTFLDN